MRTRKRWKVLVLVLIAVGAVFAVRRARQAPSVKPGSYLLLELDGTYGEGPPQDILGSLLHHRERMLMDTLTMIREAQVDTRIAGVIARVRRVEAGWGKLQDIRDALVEFKQSGKPLVALLEEEAHGSNREYYLASAADRVYLAPNVTAPLSGLAATSLFLGGVWEKLDIDMTVEKIGAYKSFGDTLANKEMTPAHREMTASILTDISDQFLAGIAQARGLEPQAVKAIVDDCPVAPADFEAARLADGTRYLEDLHEEIGGEQTPLVSMEDYARVRPGSLGLGVGPKVGVIFGVGGITTGESRTGVRGDTLGADTLVKALQDVARDEEVRAVVFRIDSPGGSALASDLVWRATQELRKKKPLIVSMSDVAASGGYYIAAGATRIVAAPGTLTGSIGVVFARPNVRGLLARFGVNTETISAGKFAPLDDLTTPLSPEGRGKLVAEMRHVYDIFLQRVASGRGLSTTRVDELAQGRVWTGLQAKERGLVDELGGFRTAVQAAKAAAGVEAKQEVELVYYPRREGVLGQLSDLLGARASAALPPTWRKVVQALALPFDDATVLALMPESIDVH
jgi:protease-4